MKVWERWERRGAPDDPTAYLFRTAMNILRNRRRRAAVALRHASSQEGVRRRARRRRGARRGDACPRGLDPVAARRSRLAWTCSTCPRPRPPTALGRAAFHRPRARRPRARDPFGTDRSQRWMTPEAPPRTEPGSLAPETPFAFDLDDLPGSAEPAAARRRRLERRGRGPGHHGRDRRRGACSPTATARDPGRTLTRQAGGRAARSRCYAPSRSRAGVSSRTSGTQDRARARHVRRLREWPTAWTSQAASRGGRRTARGGHSTCSKAAELRDPRGGVFGAGAIPGPRATSPAFPTDPAVASARSWLARSAADGASPRPEVTPAPGVALEDGQLWLAIQDYLGSTQYLNATAELRAGDAAGARHRARW